MLRSVLGSGLVFIGIGCSEPAATTLTIATKPTVSADARIFTAAASDAVRRACPGLDKYAGAIRSAVVDTLELMYQRERYGWTRAAEVVVQFGGSMPTVEGVVVADQACSFSAGIGTLSGVVTQKRACLAICDQSVEGAGTDRLIPLDFRGGLKPD